MSSFVLKEIEAGNPEDQAVLELFASSREHVVHVSASCLLPDKIAVTTKNGFVELIHSTSGEFRLFLTYLDHIPLDAALRCFSLAPSLYAISAKQQHNLVYSLSYSNELLCANVETGVVLTLATCVSRPSVVECDGDYIVCGEGNGQLSLWLGSAEESERVRVRGTGNRSLPPLMWQRRVFDDTVVCIGLHRDQLVCCSADYLCLVVAVDDGSVRASLSSLDLDRGVAAFVLTAPQLANGQNVLAVCLASRISVFASQPAGERDEAAGASARPTSALPSSFPSPSMSSARWSYRGGCGLSEGEEITCASCLGAYLAAGTRSGLVLLYACNAVTQQVSEVVRFNVGYGVKGTQLFADDTLLVVTSVGDVWRWPLQDLLSTGGRNGAKAATGTGESTDEEEEPLPETGALLPQPVVPPSLNTPVHPVQLNTTPYEVRHAQEGESEDGSSSFLDGVQHEAKTGVALTTMNVIGAAAATAEDSSTAASPAVAREDARKDGVTSVQVSSLHQGDATTLLMLSADDEDALDTQHEGDENADSLGTDGQPTEPTTTLSLGHPPLEPARTRPSFKVPEGSTAVQLAAQGKPRTPIYDPENASDSDEATRGDAPGADVLGDVSHCDSTGVSPPSSADTTAHMEAPLPADNEGTGTSTGGSSSSKRDDDRGVRKCEGRGIKACRRRSLANSLVGDTDKGEAAAAAAANSLATTSAASLEQPKEVAAERSSKDEGMAQLEAEFDQAVVRMLGPAVSIEGLRRGRRMDPRKVAGVLHNLATQRNATARVGAGGDGPLLTDSRASALAGLNSTKLLEEQRAAITSATFDFDAYRQSHRLEVDALQFQRPVKAPTYALHDRVFGGVEAVARIRGAPDDAGDDGSPSTTMATTAKKVAQAAAAAVTPAHVVQDDLRDVNYGRVKRVVDPAIVEERRRGGPELLQHCCDDLLFTSPSASSTVLFSEEVLLPSTAWEEVLLLPMPLPPAPSVF
jgi:hypothetical protein